MSELIELQDLQKKKRKSNKDLPNWIYYDENGTMKVNAQKLGYEVMKEVPMIRANELSFGARFDATIGAWRLDSLSDFLEGYITTKLESVGKWSQQKLNETKKFIWVRQKFCISYNFG